MAPIKGVHNRNRPKKRGKASKARRARDRQTHDVEHSILTSDETLHAENVSPVTTECPQHLGEKKSTPCFSFSENETSFNIQDSSGDEGLPPLIVEVEETIPEMPFPSNRVICDIGHVIAQARKLEVHSYNCKFGVINVEENSEILLQMCSD
ncbi:hypothetical protein JTE90_011978 [Oedothorax gibbosus]|uniref:Uncharacterized protein n=1 Tax=Oedothorax gibbosus TaxID=931172 RepID=A0AAV6U4L6_9ARAC|nr:hypothetical protein JTE90_011978 [Oedothorax gibbosus]